MIAIDDELRRIYGNNSHAEYPLLRVDYSPASRYPAGDFTPWIANKLTERQFNDIAELFQELTKVNPGLNVGRDSWKKYVQTLCNINLRENIVFDDDKGYIDLHSALFTYMLHGSLDEFMLVDSYADYLARSICPYQLGVRDLEVKVNLANEFIKKMRRETKKYSTVWKDYPLFDLTKLTNVLNVKAPAYNLRVKLRTMSVGARQLFLDTIARGAGQGGFSARPFGINEDLVSREVANLGIGELCDQPEIVLMMYRNEQLFAALTGYPIKLGWNKKYIIKYMLQSAPDVVSRLTQDKYALVIPQQIMEEGKILAEWVCKIQNPLVLALSFM